MNKARKVFVVKIKNFPSRRLNAAVEKVELFRTLPSVKFDELQKNQPRLVTKQNTYTHGKRFRIVFAGKIMIHFIPSLFVIEKRVPPNESIPQPFA